MIALIDYGLGNIQAFANIYKQLNIPCVSVSDPQDLELADKIILPGVGSFDAAMSRLGSSGMMETLENLVVAKRIPILGICVGMQMMARSSDEGSMPGLGWIDGEVKHLTSLDAANKEIILPHMGWNDVEPAPHQVLFSGMETPRFYFLHSYCMRLGSLTQHAASTTYSSSFSSAVQNKNIYGVQFHPEKSHNWGMKLLQNFANL